VFSVESFFEFVLLRLMKKLNFLFLLISVAFAAQAQQPFFQERAYMLSPVTKWFRAGTATANGQLLLAAPYAIPGSADGSWQNRYMLINPVTLDTIWTRQGSKMLYANQGLTITINGAFVGVSTVNSKVTPTFNKNVIQLQKLRANGSIQWTQQFTNALGGGLNIELMPDKGYMLGGAYGLNKYISFIRIDSLGNILWSKDYSRNGKDSFTQMTAGANGNFLAIGMTSYPYPMAHIKAVLVNSNGDSIKALQLIVNGFNRRETVSPNGVGGVIGLSDGGFLINASVDTTLSTGTAYMSMLVKLDANLNIVWKYIDRSNLQVVNAFHKMLELTDGSILTLVAQVSPNTTNQFSLYRFSPNGQVMNIYPFISTNSNKVYLYTFNALPDSSFVLGGINDDINNPINQGYYVAQIKLPGLKGRVITATKPELAAADFTLGQSYPNPATESAIIPFNLPNNYKQASIQIRDITGREVDKYAIKKHSSSLEVNLKDFSNGLYTYTLLVDEKPVGTKKLSVIK
jgi:hypothetical protein